MMMEGMPVGSSSLPRNYGLIPVCYGRFFGQWLCSLTVSDNEGVLEAIFSLLLVLVLES